jgi:hybrid polyketide synthase/nonribosomal peptide synthetase ACE1
MARRIEVSQHISLIDWDDETVVDRGLSGTFLTEQQALKINSEEEKTGKIVVLTGATGYCGSYLLHELIANPAIQTIHCVAVRGQNLSHAQSRIPLSSSPKVIVHVGDLSNPHLGLTGQEVDYLTANADLIIHSGARRSFWDSYYELRGANVQSSKVLVAIAAPRRVPIEFLSTSGVLLLDNTIDGQLEASVQGFKPPSNGEEGYTASKWASEAFLENAGRYLELRVKIHRFTPRVKPNEDRTELAALEDLIESTVRLGALPERSTWTGRFDVLRTADLAERIVTAAVNEVSSDDVGQSVVGFKHHSGEACLSPTRLFDFLESRLDDTVKERVGLLEKCGYPWLFSTHDLALIKEENGLVTKLVNRR